MKFTTISEVLWGQKAKLSYLFLATSILLFSFLGSKELWTQEHRWADIVSGMFYRNDYLHPYLGLNTYYDKPLLSYWLIVLFVKLTGLFSTWTLRLPSAISALLAVWSIYSLGNQIKNKSLGLLSGWLLITTFYFLFWARTSSADMMNLAGSLFAIAWFFEKRKTAKYVDYAVFFIILALTSLCKGLVGAIVPLIAVFANLVIEKSWKQHLRFSLFFATIPALIIYSLPFLASSLLGGETYEQNGLYLVYKENVLRYFQPFDHKGPIYTYFLYLPIYLMPWALFFVPALFSLKNRFHSLSPNMKWVLLTLVLLFAFFTLSGSRRSYYVLPMVPFGILVTADWILSGNKNSARQAWATGIMLFSFLGLFLALDLIPAWYYGRFGVSQFADTLKQEATKIQAWEKWNVVMLDGEEKLNFYLQLPPQTKNYSIREERRYIQTEKSVAYIWPILTQKTDNTIYISRKLYEPLLQGYFAGYRIIEIPGNTGIKWLKKHEMNAPIAFIPNH